MILDDHMFHRCIDSFPHLPERQPKIVATCIAFGFLSRLRAARPAQTAQSDSHRDLLIGFVCHQGLLPFSNLDCPPLAGTLQIVFGTNALSGATIAPTKLEPFGPSSFKTWLR